MIKVFCLIENLSNDSDLEPEHGLSFLIELKDKKILFDTGGSDKFIKNAEKMDLNLEKVDMVIISHGHYDHGGGLGPLFNINPHAPIYMAKGADNQHLKISDKDKEYIGLDQQVLADYKSRIQFIDDICELKPGVNVLVGINPKYPGPNNSNLFTFEENRLVKDKFQHELILVIESDNGLVVFTGCSHSGILNMIDLVLDKYPEQKILAVIGGLHLMIPPNLNSLSGTKEEVEDLGEKLLNRPIETFYTGHCTGKSAYSILKDIMGTKIQYLSTGDILKIK